MAHQNTTYREDFKICISHFRRLSCCKFKCPVCNHENFSTLELIGVHDKPVFWECEECGSLHCRKDRAWIESRIDKLDDLWTNPNDWDESNKDQLN